MSERVLRSNLRLPTFVTGEAVGELLSWVNSIRREFRRAADETTVTGWVPGKFEHDIYEDIVRLLGLPCGGLELNRLVTGADGEKRRGLTRAIHKKARAVLGANMEQGDGPADVALKLLIADEPALAAWVAFERMAWTRGPDADAHALVELVEQEDGLRAALGDYWPDWLALAIKADGDAGEGAPKVEARFDGNETRVAVSPAKTDELPDAQSTAASAPPLADSNNQRSVGSDRAQQLDTAAADRAAWAAELEDLREELRQASDIDVQLLARLTLSCERLEPLVSRAQQRSDQDDVRLAEEAAGHLGRLRVELDAFSNEASWHQVLIASAERIHADSAGVSQLRSLADWAISARALTEAAAARRQSALDQAQTDDSDEAGAELTAANAERRGVRQALDREAADWTARLSADATDLTHIASAGEVTSWPAPKSVVVETEAAVESETPMEAAQKGGELKSQDAEPSAVSAPAISPELPEPGTGESSAGEAVEPSAVHSAIYDYPSQRNSSDDLTSALIETDPQEVGSNRGHLVERALVEGRYGLAAHLQRAFETLGTFGSPPAPSDVLEALCIGNSLTAARLAAAEHRYAAVLPRVLAELTRPPGAADGVRLLAFAGALKPALFSMQTSAAEAIRGAAIGGLGTNLHELSEFVVSELPKRGGLIDLAGLRPVGDEQAARDELERLRAALLEMADEAPAKRAMFARASIIWREQFQKDGAVSRAIGALRRPSPNATVLVQQAADELEGHLSERARELDRAAKRNRDGWLEGRPLDWLLGSLRQLTDLLHAYAVAARRAAAPTSTHSAETQKLLAEVVAAARRDVAELTRRPDLAVAAEVTERVLRDVAALLAGRADSTESALSLDALLDGDLLLVRPYPAAARNRNLNRDGALALLDGAEVLLDAEPDFDSAFLTLLETGRFHEAAEAAERAAGHGPGRQKLDQELADARLARLEVVSGRAERLRTQLDDLLGADTEGRIDPAASVRLESLAGAIVRPELDASQVAQDLDFPTIEAELDRIEITVQEGAELLLAPLRREIEGLEVPQDTAAVLRELAERRELTTLRECVDGLKQGADMDLAGQPEKLLRSFSEGFLSPGFTQIDARQRNAADLLQTLKERRDSGVVDFSLLAEEDVPAAEGLLGAWVRLKRAGPDQTVALREVLTELRFTNVRISEEKKLPRAHRYTVLCGVTFDRRDCPVPAFGSAANGRLEVLVVEAVNVADGVELHGLVKGLEHASTVPTLVIVKGMLPSDRRLAFMREARRRAGQESCALIDEAGIFFLATWPGRRRADTYAVALPSGGVQPYSDASGKTSPEMFFGRADALGELWRADGSCLVFGGRQLGKTALLEQVRRRNHKPPGQVVVYGSFQGETDIWRKVAQLLNQGGLPVKGHSASAVESAVREGLKENSARRILILIDEADTYLEKEMQEGYPTLARVRDLMQATDRRCKFVFAGLHNVQRLARAPNSPLLHFGTPLRIGPLFGQDLGEAREMVVGPMAAVGIVFENATLPNRILSAVGFYPSLLQTFGATLIDRVNRNAQGRLKPAAPLPIVVSDHDIQNALEDHDFKENIRNKFRMTLSLDERYRLITLAMLQRSLERRDHTSIAASSLTDVEVQALARDWWPQGFEEDSSLDAFQGLLQEMVGLGVLVESGGRYAIRSSRIAAMLGGKEQIDQELIELSSSPGPETLDTGSLRRLDRTNRVPSPLTSRQESQLLGRANTGSSVHLALGSHALGLDRVATSLAELQDEELAISTAVYKTARELGTQLANARDQMRSGRRSLIVLNGPWLGREMVEMALEAGVRRVGRTGVLRVLIAPGWIDWRAVDDIDDQGRLWDAELLSLSTLGRGGLGQWLRARNVSETPQIIETLRSMTGGFPQFLDLGRGADVIAAAREAYARRMASPDILEMLGLGDERLLAAARIAAEFDPEDLAGDLNNMGVGPGEKVISHLERLGVLDAVQAAGHTRWRLNPFVAAVLSPRS